MYWLQLMDKYAANWSVLLIAISECILVAWVYGADRFLDDVQHMIGPRNKCWRFFWTWMWKVVTPATLFFILFFNWIEYEPLSYGTYIYPIWADAVGWIVGMLPVLVIISFAVVSFSFKYYQYSNIYCKKYNRVFYIFIIILVSITIATTTSRL